MKKDWYVGIDVSKKWLDVAIFVENSELKGYSHTQVGNNKSGYKELLEWLKEHDVDASTCMYGMEHTGFYSDGLQHFLDKKGYKYTMLEPAVIKHYPIQPREKNDRLDAAKIADYLFRFKEIIKFSRVPDKTMEELRNLHRERKFYVEDRVVYLNRKQVVGKEEAKRLDKIISLLDKQVESIEEKIRDIIRNDESLMESYLYLTSITGIAFVNAVNAIVITQNFTVFKTARDYASYIGVAPHTKKSGTTVRWKPKPYKHCDLTAKADISQAAKIAIVHDVELKRFFERKCNGKEDADTIRKAMNAVKFKLVLRMFAVVKQKHEYRQFTTK
ncbi:IS110 family transposase [Xylanibacter ruminicola]|uniref:IS110 family transposase n=1 Tax=Xylanibacter ruminicola TaxID=839 RepID=UPI00048D9BB4|nr:IS110 family transposase [Xylanibacter ruminicola]